MKKVATLLRTSATLRRAAHRCHRELMTMGRNELFAFSSANILPSAISSRCSARKSPRILGKMRCVRTHFCKAVSPSEKSHPTYSRPRHPSASCALKGLQVRKHCTIFFIKKKCFWMLSHSSCRPISSSASVVGRGCGRIITNRDGLDHPLSPVIRFPRKIERQIRDGSDKFHRN